MPIRYRGTSYKLERHPASGDGSLRANSAADEHILRYLDEQDEPGKSDGSPLVIHDRFGALSIPLSDRHPVVVTHLKSQESSILKNLDANGIDRHTIKLIDPLHFPEEAVNQVLMRIPKSLELFRFSLSQLSRSITSEASVVAAFMTRHFSPEILKIAGEFFGTVDQSQAWKKSRLLFLSDPKFNGEETTLSQAVMVDGTLLKQYPGVFSSGHIDHATSFLLEHLEPCLDMATDKSRVLDLGCGNGVIALATRKQLPDVRIDLLDDSFLAVESAKLNFTSEPLTYNWNDSLSDFEAGTFNLIITNPPFHFEHEIDYSVPLRLFREARRVLAPGGAFLLVANRHLNYGTHLKDLFDTCATINRDERFEILGCQIDQ